MCYLITILLFAGSTVILSQDVRDFYPIAKGNLWLYQIGIDTNTIWSNRILRDSMVVNGDDTLVYAITTDRAMFIEVNNYKLNRVELRDTASTYLDVLYPIYLKVGEEYYDSTKHAVNIRKIKCVRDGKEPVSGKPRDVRVYYSRYVNTITNEEQDGSYYYLARGIGLYNTVTEPSSEATGLRVCIIDGDTIGIKKMLPVSVLSQDEQLVIVSPNPVDRMLSVRCRKGSIKSVSLYSIVGSQLIDTIVIADSYSTEIAVDLTKYESGIYCLHIETSCGYMDRMVAITR